MQRKYTSANVLGYCAIVAVSACFFTCNDPFPGILYTFKTGDICGCGGPAEHLVYVKDESGNILDVRVYKSNQPVQLLTLKQPALRKLKTD